MRYIETFDTHSQYIAYRDSNNYVRPNVSWCIDNNEVHYNYYPPIVAKFDVTSTSSGTSIMGLGGLTLFNEIEIDGVVQPSVNNYYTFDTTGEHTVKYTLIDSTEIGNKAFQYCMRLTSVNIPNSVTSIGQYAFYGCTALTNVTIPNSITSIGYYAFRDCIGLTNVTIPNSVTTIDSHAFNNCDGLTSITIPNSVTSIGDYAFYQCNNLTSLTIGSGVTTIGDYVFQSCSGLTSVTIGSGVTSIGKYTFYGCSGLTSVTIQATTPPTLSNANAFNNTNDCPIYVPSASVATYQAATNWSTYASRIQAIPS